LSVSGTSTAEACLTGHEPPPLRQSLRARVEQEAGNLASLTGWAIEDIRRKVGPVGDSERTPDSRPWWQKLFGE